MELPWRILAERWETGWFGYVAGLPGCLVTAPTLDGLLASAPQTIATHLAWLQRRGIPVSERPPERIVLAESAEALPGGIGPLFEADRSHLSAAELDLALRVGQATIEEIFELADATRGWEAATHPGRPPGWTPPQILRHIADLDLWYAGRLMPDVGALALPGDALVRVQRAHQAFTSSMRAWWALWKNRVIERDGERWTIGKVLRRRTAHLREHAGQLAEWV